MPCRDGKAWEQACELLHADRKSARFRTHALVVCRVHLPPRIAGVLREHPGLLRLANGVGSSISGAVGRQEDVGGFANRPISSPRRKAEWLEDPARQRRLYLQLAYAGTASGEPIFLRSKRTLTPMTSVAVAFRAAASAWAGVMCAQEERGYGCIAPFWRSVGCTKHLRIRSGARCNGGSSAAISSLS